MTALAAAPPRHDASIDDGALVGQVRLGRDDAFEELYRRHHAHVTGIVTRMLRDSARSEDVVQDAFISALRRLRETDSDIKFRAWISEIARNATIDQFRRSGRAREISIDADQALAPVDALRLAGGPSPEVSAIGRERFGHFRGALDELSDTHQRVIVLRELEGHSYREIGELMHLTPSGVESTLFRARRRLEQEYEQLDSGVRCVATEAAIERLGRGEGLRRDRRKLDRHAARCSTCRRHARERGIEPMLPGNGLGAKVAALLPFPALAGHRRGGLGDQLRSFLMAGSQSGRALAPAAGPAWEQGAPVIAKTLAVIAAATVIGHSPATVDARRHVQPPVSGVTHQSAAATRPGPAATRHRRAPSAPGTRARSALDPAATAPQRSGPASRPRRRLVAPPHAVPSPGSGAAPRAAAPRSPATPDAASVVGQAPRVPGPDPAESTRGAGVMVPQAGVPSGLDAGTGTVEPLTSPVTGALGDSGAAAQERVASRLDALVKRATGR